MKQKSRDFHRALRGVSKEAKENATALRKSIEEVLSGMPLLMDRIEAKEQTLFKDRIETKDQQQQGHPQEPTEPSSIVSTLSLLTDRVDTCEEQQRSPASDISGLS